MPASRAPARQFVRKKSASRRDLAALREPVSKSLIGALALMLPGLVLVAGFPPRPMILGVLNDAAHGPVFAVLAVLIAFYLRAHTGVSPRWLYPLSFGIAFLTGFVVELIQPLVGRHGQAGDLLTNAVGAAGGLSALVLASSRRKLLPGIVLAAACALVGWPVLEAGLGYLERARQAPSLLELSSRSDWYFLAFHGFNASKSGLPPAWGRPDDPPSLRLQLTADSARKIHDLEPIRDWSRHRLLLMDLTNPGAEALDLTFRIHDSGHNNQPTDRFNRHVRLRGHSRITIEIPIAEIRDSPRDRKLDLMDVSEWILFTATDAELTGRVFYITRIWLE